MIQRGQSALIGIAILLSGLAIAVVVWGPSVVNGQVDLFQRWNPRRAPVNVEFLGDRSCAECHGKISRAHGQSGMALTMKSVADTDVLIQNPKLSMTVGPYTYEIKRVGKESFYSVTDGTNTISLPIVYAIGQGRMGQTYLLQQEGKFYESLVSFYKETKGLDFTIGVPRTVPKTLSEAVGRLLNENELANCFGCHSSGAVRGSQLQLEKLAHGVRCEGCHGPGGQHLAAVKEGKPGGKLIFNPGRLSGDEVTQQFCAACHRGADEFALLKSMGLNNVRFQPYRIFNSKCYSDDERISCTGCHDPHEPLNESAAYYDAKCLACHAVKGKPAAQGSLAACPVDTKNCASCHMPKIEIPAAHFKFTDHYIRIAKPGEMFPN